MPAWLNGALRAALQAAWAWLAATAAKKGIELPADTPLWLETAALAAVAGVVVGAIQWLERRSGDTLLGRAGRWLAKVAMLGLRPAVYPKLPSDVIARP